MNLESKKTAYDLAKQMILSGEDLNRISYKTNLDIDTLKQIKHQEIADPFRYTFLHQ